MIPPHCPRCFMEFATVEAREVHIASEKRCDLNAPPDQSQGISPSTLLWLRSRKGRVGLTETEKWRHMWDIVFPGVSCPSDVSADPECLSSQRFKVINSCELKRELFLWISSGALTGSAPNDSISEDVDGLLRRLMHREFEEGVHKLDGRELDLNAVARLLSPLHSFGFREAVSSSPDSGTRELMQNISEKKKSNWGGERAKLSGILPEFQASSATSSYFEQHGALWSSKAGDTISESSASRVSSATDAPGRKPAQQNDDLQTDATLTLTEYSDDRSLAGDLENHFTNFIAGLNHCIGRGSLDAEGVKAIVAVLPNLLQQYAMTIGYNAPSQAYRDVMFFVYKYRKFVFLPLVNLDLQFNTDLVLVASPRSF